VSAAEPKRQPVAREVPPDRNWSPSDSAVFARCSINLKVEPVEYTPPSVYFA